MAGLLIQNTAGDRKEIRRMLTALSPMDRLRFLCECAVILNNPRAGASARNMPLKEARRCDRADERVTDAIYMDILYMATQYGLDLDAVVNRLAAHVSRPAGLRENPSVQKALDDALRMGGWTDRAQSHASVSSHLRPVSSHTAGS